MSEADGVKCWRIFVQRGKRAHRALGGEASERAERFEVADADKPNTHATAVVSTPRFNSEHAERRPEDEAVHQLHKPVVAGLQPFKVALEFCNGSRRRKAFAAECRRERG